MSIHSEGLETRFDTTFTAVMAQRENQIQQNYRPIIGVHKWFARRPGTVFRNLLLAEFNGDQSIEEEYWKAHNFSGIIADPFMGGGTPIFESNRLGFSVIGTDINPMAYWIVKQSLTPLDIQAFDIAAQEVLRDVENTIGDLYTTKCTICGQTVSAKYFIWVKTQTCPHCGTINDLFPRYLLAEATRHPMHVVACNKCYALNEYENQPTETNPERCQQCDNPVYVQGPARRNKIECKNCGKTFSYPSPDAVAPPVHRMWAIEYHCNTCKPHHKGRFFKKPDLDDLQLYRFAEEMLKKEESNLPIPKDLIPDGDETHRLHRWGYTSFRQMFNSRQLLGLGVLLKRIDEVVEDHTRHALLTVFSDFLRYQNMLCRYDTYALKCQDIFSVHGFPVGLVPCENNLLGIPKIGSGAYRHFLDKYIRAKKYCVEPFETRLVGRKKQMIPVIDERIEATLVDNLPQRNERQAYIKASPANAISLPPNSIDGVFTDPPYYDNVQYAELMDFCYVWLRQSLREEFPEFKPTSTRALNELTGNATMQRGLDRFTLGLSEVFKHYAAALKPGAPFVFTYHHNSPEAYIPVVVAILDSALDCTATLSVPAEMNASLHIAHTKSSILDTVFVCRRYGAQIQHGTIEDNLRVDVKKLEQAELNITEGDLRCLLSGHIARVAVNLMGNKWDSNAPLSEKMETAGNCLSNIGEEIHFSIVIRNILTDINTSHDHGGDYATPVRTRS